MKRLAILVSGNGTNMANVIQACQAGKIPADPALIVSDNPTAGALQKAKNLKVDTALIERGKFSTKSDFEKEIIRQLEAKKIDLVALAGFMRILSPEFIARFRGRIVNVHPALLPAFPGAHAIRDAYEAKVKETGVTVHFVDEGVDTGPVILQEKIPVLAKDTLESLEARIHEAEYRIYPEALRLVLSGEIKLPAHHREDEFWTND